jgi:hypothetical protein
LDGEPSFQVVADRDSLLDHDSLGRDHVPIHKMQQWVRADDRRVGGALRPNRKLLKSGAVDRGAKTTQMASIAGVQSSCAFNRVLG